ncbi:MAG: glycerophosphodiester phosphodiesterase [Pseudomonadota bacterium]
MNPSCANNKWIFGGHRGMGCTDHDFYQDRDIGKLPVENTIDSIVLALKNGAAYVECDAVPTADGQVVIIHNVVPADHFFGPDTPHAMLNTLAYTQISRFATGRHSRGIVPLISDALKTVAPYTPGIGDFNMNIEIKGGQGSGQPYETGSFLENLARDVRASAVPLNRVLFSSFSLANILAMSHLVPEARYGMLYNEKTVSTPIYADHGDDLKYRYLPFGIENMQYVAATWKDEGHADAQLSYVHPETRTITLELIAHAAIQGWAINTWDYLRAFDKSLVNDYRHIHQLCSDNGIPVTFITDYIPEMRRALGLR